ncbi:MAG: hypothetical protein JXB07_12575 [Anaerolineae bacterium]|nr:hypothetical protein [Anaerolineae bacterium]
MLFVLLFAGALRYTGYDFGLPYIENSEEARLNILAQDVVTTGKVAPEDTQAPYPLGMIGIHYILLSWFHSLDALPSTILPVVRLLSVTISLTSIILIALLGYRISTPSAGLAAAVLWSIMPEAVRISRTGMASSFITFCLLLSLFLTLSGILYHRPGWVLWGCVALMFAALFSYQAVLLAPLLVLFPLVRLHRSNSDVRQAVLRNLGDQVFLFTLFLMWLLWLSPLVVSIKIGRWGIAFGDIGMLGFVHNLLVPLSKIIQNATWIAGLTGLGWLWWPRFRHKVWLFGIIAIILFGVTWCVVVSAEYTQDFEHLMLIGALSAVIGGTGAAGWGEAILWVVERMMRSKPGLALSRIGNAVIVALVFSGSVPLLQASIADARQHVLPDRRNALAVWADTTLEGANHIADASNDRVLNATFGGYRGLSMFPMVETALITDRPLEAWRAREVMYAITSYAAYQDMRDAPADQSHLDQMVLLKSYPPSKNYRDAGMVVFRLYPIQNPVNVRLGPIHLIGYDLDHTEIAPGENLTIRYYWQAAQPTETINRVFNHLYPLDTIDPVAQIDGPPLIDLRRPTTAWNDPNETVVSQAFVLTLGFDVAPGKYQLATGFYDPDTGQRLLTSKGESFVIVTVIQVTRN